MRRAAIYLLALGLVWALAAPALARVALQDILVNWQGRKSVAVNIRVTLTNPGSSTQQGPVVVSLFVRHRLWQNWRKIQEWDDIDKILPGNKVSRDYFGNWSDPPFLEAVRSGRFEVKAVVTTPDGQNLERVREVVSP